MPLCPACNTDNPPANRFCDQCGLALDGAAPAASPSPTPPPAAPSERSPQPERLLNDVEVITIGRAHACDFVIESGIYDQVSRRHAEIREYADGRLEIVDRGSANKTFVNGRALEPGAPHPLALTDHVRLGSYELNMAEVRRRLPHDSSRWPSAAPPVAPSSRALAAAPPPVADASPSAPRPPAPATDVPPAPRRAAKGLATHQWVMLATIIALGATIAVALLTQ